MPVTEAIAPHHDTESFTCGSLRKYRERNDFLHQHGRDKSKGATYVVVPAPGSPEVLAYYTLWPDPSRVEAIPVDAEGVEVNVIWLQRLAVAAPHQRRGMGTRILSQVIDNTVRAARRHPGIEALMLLALDEQAMRWYLGTGFGFETVDRDSGILVLPLAPLLLLRDESSTGT